MDILNHAFEGTGYTVQLEYHPWARCLSMVETGKADCIIGVFFKEERTRFLGYPDPVLSQDTAFFQLVETNHVYSTMADLKAFKIARVRLAVNSAEFDRLSGPGIIELRDLPSCIQMLLHGRVDMLAGPVKNIEYLMKTYFPEDVGKIKLVEPLLARHAMHIGVSKNSNYASLLLPLINERMQTLRTSGVYDSLLAKHGF